MTAQDVNLSSPQEAERIQCYRNGAQMIFENAEALYNEAQTLGTAGSYARAAVLHQLSMEECAKIDMLGAHLTSILMGHPVDEALIERKFREHRLKNYANAYNFETLPEEQEARARGDWKASSKVFRDFQAQFHHGVNNLKNDGLYVDFKNGRFSSPKEAITEETAATALHLNGEFLQRSALFIRLLKRIETDPEKYSRFSKQFLERAQILMEDEGLDPETATRQLLEELKDSYV
jgi:AbiV family abortive infection protein